MKKIVLLFTVVAFVMSSVSVKAQSEAPESVFNTAELTYSPTIMSFDFGLQMKLKFNSVAAEWSQARLLPVGFPLYLQYGAGLQYTTGKIDIFSKDARFNMLSAKVPVNVMYVHTFSKFNISVMPYAGLNVRCNLLAQSKDKYEDWDEEGEEIVKITNMLSEDDMDGDPFNRFVMGWQVGAKVAYDRYMLGIGYEGPVTSLYKIEDGVRTTVGYVNISLGIKF